MRQNLASAIRVREPKSRRTVGRVVANGARTSDGSLPLMIAQCTSHPLAVAVPSPILRSNARHLLISVNRRNGTPRIKTCLRAKRVECLVPHYPSLLYVRPIHPAAHARRGRPSSVLRRWSSYRGHHGCSRALA